MDNIDAVTFDLWQTLIIDNRELGRSRTARRLDETSKCLEESGYYFDYGHIQEAYRRCYRICREIHFEGKDYSFDHQVLIFIENIGADLPQELTQGAVERINYWYGEAFFDFPPLVDPLAHDMLRRIKDNGYKIGLISNTGMTPGRLFRRYLGDNDLLDFFDVLTFSDEVLLCKPSAAIFNLTLDGLESVPGRSLHVGDHVKNDILGANNAGMKSVLLGTAEGQEMVANPDYRIMDLKELYKLL